VRKVLSALFVFMLASPILAEYLTVVKGDEDLPGGFVLYAYHGDINIGLTPYFVVGENVLVSVPFERGEDYFLISNWSGESMPNGVLFVRDGFMIARGSDVLAWEGRGEVVRLCFDVPAQKPYPVWSWLPREHRAKALDYAFLDSLTQNVDVDSLYNTVAILSGEWPYPSGYYNTSRFIGQPGCDTAANYLYFKFIEYGLDTVYFQDFTVVWNGDTFVSKNVVGVKRGIYSDRCVVVGAHYDDISEPFDDYTSIAPGADDNASGVCGVMEIARTMAGMGVESDVYFVCFGGEELGLHGSYHFVYDYIVPNGIFVKGMVNMDMIGHTEGGYEVRLYGENFSDPIKNLFKDIADNITTLTTYIYGPSYGSDHYYFEQAGFVSLFAIEYDFSPVYHTSSDSISYLTFDFLREIVRSGLGTAYVVMESPASVESLQLADNGDSSVLVSWVKSAEGDVSEYVIYYGIFGDSTVQSVAVPDTDSWIIGGLVPDTLYGFCVCAVDTEGYESFGRSATITPSFVPHAVSILDVYSDSASVYLCFSRNLALDFDHYNVYRRRLGDVDFTLIGTTVDTFFVDATVSDTAIYDYAVSVVDTTGLESEFSNVVQCRLITLVDEMLVLDETYNNRSLPDVNTDAFYDSVFGNYPCVIWDADSTDTVDIVELGNYKVVVYIDDDRLTNKVKFSHLIDYIECGGKLLYIGADAGYKFVGYPTVFPCYVDTASDVYKVLGIEWYNHKTDYDMDYLVYDDGTVPFTPGKLFVDSLGYLLYGGVFGLNGGVGLGWYHSASGDTVFDGGISVFANSDTSFVLLNAPLYSMVERDAEGIVGYLLSMWGIYPGVRLQTGALVSREVAVCPIVSDRIVVGLAGFNGEYISVDVYDVAGRRILDLYKGTVGADRFTVERSNTLPSGVYFVMVRSHRGYVKTEKVIAIR